MAWQGGEGEDLTWFLVGEIKYGVIIVAAGLNIHHGVDLAGGRRGSLQGDHDLQQKGVTSGKPTGVVLGAVGALICISPTTAISLAMTAATARAIAPSASSSQVVTVTSQEPPPTTSVAESQPSVSQIPGCSSYSTVAMVIDSVC